MTCLGIILILLGMLLIYWKNPYSPQKSNFNKDISTRLNNTSGSNQICTQEEIDRLPEALRKHCEYIGLAGSIKHNVVNAIFDHTNFIFNDDLGKVLKMDYDLWLFTGKPYRAAYCTSSMYGIPFEGQDYCTDDKQGGMKGTIGKAVQIFDVKNEQMYVAGMISILAEAVALNPCFLLSPYVSYKEIDETHIEATISYNGIQGTGIFTFAEDGSILAFESDERQVGQIDGKMVPIGWRAECKAYKEMNGIKIPSLMRAVKVYPDREIVYFDADKISIKYYGFS